MKKRKKLTIEAFSVDSFVTTGNLGQIQGGSNCCLRDTEADYNCYTWGHFSDCGSTGNTDNPTGGMNMTQAACNA